MISYDFRSLAVRLGLSYTKSYSIKKLGKFSSQ